MTKARDIAELSVDSDGNVSLSATTGVITTDKIDDDAITPAKLDREYATKGTSIALSIALG